MIRVAVIGVGNWGKNLARNFFQISTCDLTACCDADPARQEFVQRTFPGVKFTTSAGELFQDDQVDAVVISSPTLTHYPLAKEALLGGKHVFVEKPLTHRVEEARELIALAEKQNKVLMVGHLMRYHPAIKWLKDFVSSGELGELYYLYTQRLNLGQVRNDENALWNFAPHDISLALDLFEASPRSIVAVGQSYLQPGIEDVVFLNIKFDNQRMAQLHMSWLDPHKVRRMTIVGSRKMAVFDDMENMEKVRLYDKGVDQVSYKTYGEALSLRFGDILIPRISMTEPLRLECEHFLDCVKDGKTPVSDGAEGLRVLQVLEAAQRSMEQGGGQVELDAETPPRDSSSPR